MGKDGSDGGSNSNGDGDGNGGSGGSGDNNGDSSGGDGGSSDSSGGSGGDSDNSGGSGGNDDPSGGDDGQANDSLIQEMFEQIWNNPHYSQDEVSRTLYQVNQQLDLVEAVLIEFQTAM